jgi:hypothetical protein
MRQHKPRRFNTNVSIGIRMREAVRNGDVSLRELPKPVAGYVVKRWGIPTKRPAKTGPNFGGAL